MYGAVQTARTEGLNRAGLPIARTPGKPSHKTTVQQSANLNGDRLRLLNEIVVRVLLHQGIPHFGD